MLFQWRETVYKVVMFTDMFLNILHKSIVYCERNIRHDYISFALLHQSI